MIMPGMVGQLPQKWQEHLAENDINGELRRGGKNGGQQMNQKVPRTSRRSANTRISEDTE